MRGIKFRAWDTEHSKWVYFDQKQLEQHYDTDQSHSDQETLAWVMGTEWYQSTGLLDMNRMEIYEGDIIRQENNEYIGDIVWKKGGYWANLSKDDRKTGFWLLGENIYIGKIEVIGNIHDSEVKE